MLIERFILTDNGFIERFLEDSFTNFGTEFDIIDVIIVLFWAIILSFVIAITYRGTHRGVSYSYNFTQNLVLLGIIVSIIMLIIGSNIARAFTLVGALSIVRFRSAIKDARDLGFIFFTMAMGMACGTRFYPIAIMITFIGCLLMYFMTITKFGQKFLAQDILEMNLPKSKDYAEVLSPIFTQYLKYFSLLSIDSIDEEYNRLSFIITFKKHNLSLKMKRREVFKDSMKTKSSLISKIQESEYISGIKLIEGSSAEEL